MNSQRPFERSYWAAPGQLLAGCYPGEPVFVAAPGNNSQREDDGVLLSLVLDVEAGGSFLLVLDDSSMQEIARLALPQATPFTFHGVFEGR